MLIYLLAFALTAFFVSRTARYYRASLPQTVSGERSVCDRPKFRDLDVRYLFWFALSLFPLFFVAAVRYDVGTDYFYTYIPNFYLIEKGESPYSEWGFNLLNRVIAYFTDDAQWLIVVTSFIYVFCVIRTVIHCSETPSLSVVILFLSCLYFIALNNVRQAIAAAIVFSAVPYIVKPGYLKFFLAVFFAYLFHQTVLLMLIPFFLVNIRFIRRNFLPFAVAVTLLLPVICAVASAALQYTKYSYYFVSDFNDNSATKIYIVYHFIFLLLSGHVLYRSRMRDKYGYVLLFMQFFAFWVSATSMFIRISEMISRLTVFFSIFQLLLIPHMCACLKRQGESLAIVCIYIFLYSLYLVFSIFVKGYHQVLPYQWIF